MTDVLFSELDLPETLARGVEAMGFETATPIQAQTIPVLRTGADVIARSQTGTGKTVAFSVPVLERINTKEDKPTVQALILCPTRELAQQAGEEIRKLSKFMPGIRPVEVYGGTDMERQFIRLRRANLVIGTPGRVMDHMRRKTLKLENLKMIVLDEADEMLNMGFKEDIETILQDTSPDRQTILFSATMPPAILALTQQFQKDPKLIEIDKGQITIESIDQSFVEVPLARKSDALLLLLRYHRPQRALIFCNTKRMVDELAGLLHKGGFSAECIHGDLSQAQRTNVMNSFKRGAVSILIATDVAARGIDVNDLDYVINYDIPMTTDYYIHRIGRTGRAGKSGRAITLCSGKRQMHVVRGIAHEVKSDIRQDSIPTPEDIRDRETERDLAAVETALTGEIQERYLTMASALAQRGHEPERIAAAVLQMQFAGQEVVAVPIPTHKGLDKIDDRGPEKRERRTRPPASSFTELLFDIGSANRVAPNHLVGAITELSGISGKEIGKIEIYQDQSVVAVPTAKAAEVLEAMRSCKICGRPTHAMPLAEQPEGRKAARPRKVEVHKLDPRRDEPRPVHRITERLVKRRDVNGGDPVRHRPKED